MGGKQGIHSENCISWQAGSHADLVLDCRNGRAERMPGSVMLNPVPQGSKRHSEWWAPSESNSVITALKEVFLTSLAKH